MSPCARGEVLNVCSSGSRRPGGMVCALQLVPRLNQSAQCRAAVALVSRRQLPRANERKQPARLFLVCAVRHCFL